MFAFDHRLSCHFARRRSTSCTCIGRMMTEVEEELTKEPSIRLLDIGSCRTTINYHHRDHHFLHDSRRGCVRPPIIPANRDCTDDTPEWVDQVLVCYIVLMHSPRSVGLKNIGFHVHAGDDTWRFSAGRCGSTPDQTCPEKLARRQPDDSESGQRIQLASHRLFFNKDPTALGPPMVV